MTMGVQEKPDECRVVEATSGEYNLADCGRADEVSAGGHRVDGCGLKA